MSACLCVMDNSLFIARFIEFQIKLLKSFQKNENNSPVKPSGA